MALAVPAISQVWSKLHTSSTTTQAEKYCCARKQSLAIQTSSTKDGLNLSIQGLALCGLTANRTETFDSELLACLRCRDAPLLQRALRKHLLASRRGSLAHDLAAFALGQSILCQASNSLRLLAIEDGCPGILATRDFAHFLNLFHGLHGGCLRSRS